MSHSSSWSWILLTSSIRALNSKSYTVTVYTVNYRLTMKKTYVIISIIIIDMINNGIPKVWPSNISEGPTFRHTAGNCSVSSVNVWDMPSSSRQGIHPTGCMGSIKFPGLLSVFENTRFRLYILAKFDLRKDSIISSCMSSTLLCSRSRRSKTNNASLSALSWLMASWRHWFCSRVLRYEICKHY